MSKFPSTIYWRLTHFHWEFLAPLSNIILPYIVVQSLSHVWLFATPWTAAPQASLSFTISWRLLKVMPIESMMPSNHLLLVAPFSSCPQSSPASGSFPMWQFFASGGQNIGASAPVLPMNIQGWFPLGLTGLNFPLQCSCLENPRDRGAWWAAIYGVAQSRTQLKRLSSSSSKWWNKIGDSDGLDSCHYPHSTWWVSWWIVLNKMK